MLSDVTLSFGDLRKIVIACHNQGLFLRNGLTFSHGNLGNEYFALAKRIDDLVAAVEPRYEFALTITDRKDGGENDTGAYSDWKGKWEGDKLERFRVAYADPNFSPIASAIARADSVRSDAAGAEKLGGKTGNRGRATKKKSRRR